MRLHFTLQKIYKNNDSQNVWIGFKIIVVQVNPQVVLYLDFCFYLILDLNYFIFLARVFLSDAVKVYIDEF